MAEDSQLIEKALDTSKACFLPKLLDDFDSKPISSSDFAHFKSIADENIHLLLDILYQNRNLLYEKIYDNQILQIRVNLILIACEQIEPNPYFHSEDQILLDSLWKITNDHLDVFEDTIYINVIEIYKKALNKKEWKKNFGHFHSFPLFCKIILQHRKNLVSNDLLLFILSVGSNLLDHYDPHIKTIGLKIYLCLLEYGDVNKLLELNIHQVIYNETLVLIQRCNELEYNKILYKCLFQIVALENSSGISNSKWCKFDDVFSKLLVHFGFESDTEVSRLLIYQVAKFCAIGCNETRLLPLDQLNTKDTKYLDELKSKVNRSNHRVMRWINSIMEAMTRESTRLHKNADEAEYFLYIYIIIYILSIKTMEPSDFLDISENFVKKLVIILMQVCAAFKMHESSISSLIKYFISSIKEHHSQNKDLVRILESLAR